MITYGIIALVVGIVLAIVGFTLHLLNMKNMINGDMSKITGGRTILPFAFIGVGGVVSVLGGLAAIVGAVLLFL